MNPRDLELLSAYLDGQLNPSDSARLESRLASDASLRAVLKGLRSTRGLLRQLPFRRAPRNFTLTPQMAGVKPPTPRAVPTLRLATALATFLFIITLVVHGLITLSAPALATAPAPFAAGAAAPMSAAQAAPAATQAPALPLAAIAPSETSAARLMAAPLLATETLTPQVILKSSPPPAENGQPVQHTQKKSSQPLDFEILFGILALGFGITSWILPRNNESSVRRKWNKK